MHSLVNIFPPSLTIILQTWWSRINKSIFNYGTLQVKKIIRNFVRYHIHKLMFLSFVSR
jgi:hypothetical protein